MENLMAKEQAKVWEMASSSSSKTYQTILYTDGYTSCDCFGWTRREKNGVRSCRHTNMVEMGTADDHCIHCKDLLVAKQPVQTAQPVKKKVAPKKKTPKKSVVAETSAPIVRKISW